MFDHLLKSAGPIVESETIDDCGTGFVQACDFHLSACAAELQNDFVECADR